MNEDVLKKTILKPEEDVDLHGNKGYFLVQKNSFKMCLLVKIEDSRSIDAEDIIK